MNRLRVLAAMSGGVDSAVAAARAADAGHEVTGVHLALSSNPQSYRSGARGCCTVEDARDARRAADVIGIPFYVWDMAERFDRDVVADFVAEYAAGRTPNPCLRCNEKIKFAAVLDRAVALGFDAVCTGHHARLRDGRLVRSVDPGKDQSYVLAVLNREQLSRAMFPLGSSTKAEVRAEAAARGMAVASQAGQPRRLLHPGRGHPGVPGGPAGRRARPHRGPGRDAGRHARRRLRLHHRPAQGAAGRGAGRGRPAPLRAGHRAGDPDRDRRAARVPGRAGDPGRAAGVERERAAARAAGVPRAAAGPRRGSPGHRRAGGGHCSGSPWTSRPGAWPRARPRCCTTATPCWAAAPSAGPGPGRPPRPNPPADPADSGTSRPADPARLAAPDSRLLSRGSPERLACSQCPHRGTPRQVRRRTYPAESCMMPAIPGTAAKSCQQ